MKLVCYFIVFHEHRFLTLSIKLAAWKPLRSESATKLPLESLGMGQTGDRSFRIRDAYDLFKDQDQWA
jgi:hypothetical protein